MPALNPNIPTARKPHARIASVQVCRGLAALLVVYAHLCDQDAKYFPIHLHPAFRFGAAGVDLFFLISGVVIAAVTRGHFPSGPKYAFRFLYQRLTRVYPIYWIYSLLVLAVYLYQPDLVNASSGSHVHILSSFLLIPTNLAMLLQQGWTLTYELYFYGVVFLLLLFCQEKWVFRSLCLWATIAVVAHYTLRPANPVLAVACGPIVCEFAVGCGLYLLYRRGSLHPSVGALLVGASVAWWAALRAYTIAAHASQPQWIDYSSHRMVLYGPMAALFLFGMMEMERTGMIKLAAPLIRMGDWSYSMYLSHIIVIKGVCYLCSAVDPGMPTMLLVALCFSAVVLVSYLSFTWIERPLLALTHKAPLGRKPQEPAPKDQAAIDRDSAADRVAVLS